MHYVIRQAFKTVRMLNHQSFYSFFTKYSELDHYGFTSGFFTKMARKLVPVVPAEDSFEFYLRSVKLQKYGIRTVANDIVLHLDDKQLRSKVYKELRKSITALIARIVAIGLDQNMQELLGRLGIDDTAFYDLGNSSEDIGEVILLVQRTEEAIQSLRHNKAQVGTSLHLTKITREALYYADRAKDLLLLAKDIQNPKAWETLIKEYLDHEKRKNSLRKHISQHLDLLALEIVEHTSQKGESYIAEDQEGVRKFFVKGLIGGAVIAVFALFKAYIYKSFDSNVQLAFWYSINYATCFILVKAVGGTIATKQPAMTASTIIRHIDRNNDLIIDGVEHILELLRKVARSQIFSLVGNFIMALLLAAVISLVMLAAGIDSPITTSKAESLVQSVWPVAGGAIAFATIAGVFLAMAGLISGYVDNKVIATRLPYRILHHRTLRRITTKSMRQKIGAWSLNKLGGIVGNVTLGFLLGCAWLLTYILPFSVDIRHIAFSSSNIGYAIVNGNFAVTTIVLALACVLLIGFTNFLVSFTLTLALALKSRGTTLKGLGVLLTEVLKDLITNPISYLWERKADNPQE